MDDFDELSPTTLSNCGRRPTWDVGESEDLVQECVFKVARSWPRVRGMTQPRAHARRILVNAVDGRTGAGVTAATIERSDGSSVEATVANGWYLAWWPGTVAATKAEVASAFRDQRRRVSVGRHRGPW
jgi:DNA-directed RNA polymerase specialized sigma24 family protein